MYPVSHMYPTSPWPFCHKRRKGGGTGRDQVHQRLTKQGWGTQPTSQGAFVGAAQEPPSRHVRRAPVLRLPGLQGQTRSRAWLCGNTELSSNAKQLEEEAQYHTPFSERKQKWRANWKSGKKARVCSCFICQINQNNHFPFAFSLKLITSSWNGC